MMAVNQADSGWSTSIVPVKPAFAVEQTSQMDGVRLTEAQIDNARNVVSFMDTYPYEI